MAQRILVGFDGSGPSRRALGRAADLAGYGSTVTVVMVTARRNGRAEHDGGRARLLLDEARGLLAERQIAAQTREPAGEPAAMLVEAARELDADVIVVGRRDRSDEPADVLGSVSSAVVEHAACDVLVVR